MEAWSEFSWVWLTCELCFRLFALVGYGLVRLIKPDKAEVWPEDLHLYAQPFIQYETFGTVATICTYLSSLLIGLLLMSGLFYKRRVAWPLKRIGLEWLVLLMAISAAMLSTAVFTGKRPSRKSHRRDQNLQRWSSAFGVKIGLTFWPGVSARMIQRDWPR